jgi:hypothetical protein
MLVSIRWAARVERVWSCIWWDVVKGNTGSALAGCPRGGGNIARSSGPSIPEKLLFKDPL